MYITLNTYIHPINTNIVQFLIMLPLQNVLQPHLHGAVVSGWTILCGPSSRLAIPLDGRKQHYTQASELNFM